MYERGTTLEMLNEDDGGGVFCKWLGVNVGTSDTETGGRKRTSGANLL